MSIVCPKCKVSYSAKVYAIHKNICKGGEPEPVKVETPEPVKTEEEIAAEKAAAEAANKDKDPEPDAELKAYIDGLTEEQVEAIRARGKELKIPAAHNKGLEKLIPEIKAVSAE